MIAESLSAVKQRSAVGADGRQATPQSRSAQPMAADRPRREDRLAWHVIVRLNPRGRSSVETRLPS